MAGATVGCKFEGKKIKIGGTFGGPMNFSTSQMLQLGSYANNIVKARTRSGVGSDDAPFPPLKGAGKYKFDIRGGRKVVTREGYAASKARKGLNPYRDMWGDGKQGGHMLDNSTVRYADSNTVRIAFTSTKQRQKASGNERRTPFYSFSANDAKKIMDFAAQLWQSNVTRVFDMFLGRRAA